MCGIWSLVNLVKSRPLKLVELFADFYRLKHRGPDNSYFETYGNVVIGFHRLAIVDDSFSSNQPFIIEDKVRTIVFVCNGEIYNWRELIEKHNLDRAISSDCRVIPEIYAQLCRVGKSEDFPFVVKQEVQGEFAFLLFEFDHLKNLQKLIVGRDEIGIRPLYFHHFNRTSDALLFTSEIKGGMSFNIGLIEFPPGVITTYGFSDLGLVNISDYYDPSLYNYYPSILYDDTVPLRSVRDAVVASVRRRLSADKPFAFLLSGGVDSSLVAAISARILGKPIRTFCCGMAGGTDLAYARKVADHIGSQHTEVLFTVQEGLDAITDVIRTVESWDTTTVRASVGQYLVSKYIGQNTDCKVVMVGEGPDEVCSSYLFNWYAPNGDALHRTADEYVRKIHYYDVKRADRCISRWGLEGRVPLLDPEFIRAYWDIEATERMPKTKGIEKWWLRQAFEGDLLPHEVLWRKKEAFSDGVSGEKSWFQSIQEWVEDKVSDEEMADANNKYPYYTPTTKEAYYYRRVFCDMYGEEQQAIIPGYWQPKWSADGNTVVEYIDPSARVLDVYNAE